MQNLKIFAVMDTKARAFDAPFVMRTNGEAERGFANIVNKADNKYSANPEDYHLFQLGEFNVETGQITPLEAAHSVASAVSLVAGNKTKH